jgi:chaperonin GroES
MRLQDLSDSTVDREELLYNASVLAHYAQVSTQPDVDVPAPSNLSAVFDHFVADSTLLNDRLMMETAGAQCLLWRGSSRTRCVGVTTSAGMPNWGASFFRRAALHEQSLHKARLLDALARRFEPWRRRHAQLSRELRDQPFLLIPPVPPSRPRREGALIIGVEIMNVRPLHDRIIIQRIEEGEQKVGGIIIPDSAKEKPQQGKVIAAGTGKIKDDGTRQQPDVKAGDVILFGKYSGQEIKLDGEEYIIMREDEILGVIEGAESKKK